MSTHWRRDEPQFYNVHELEWSSASDLAVTSAADCSMLNRNEDTGSATLMVRLPAGWHGRHQAQDGTLEVFVLEGQLTLNGESVGTSGFMFVPEGSGDSELSSEQGATALFYWTVGMPLQSDASWLEQPEHTDWGQLPDFR